MSFYGMTDTYCYLLTISQDDRDSCGLSLVSTEIEIIQTFVKHSLNNKMLQVVGI